MPPPRDPFANFDRMRRQIDELFGDVWGRTGLSPSRRAFSPRVDVYYYGDPPKAVIKADLAGVDPNEVSLEVRGRALIISGERRPRDTEGRVYQQIEIPSGHFRRVVELQVELDADRATATYEEGILRIDLPLRDPEATTRRVPIDRG
jgi:HSP20 family protein